MPTFHCCLWHRRTLCCSLALCYNITFILSWSLQNLIPERHSSYRKMLNGTIYVSICRIQALLHSANETKLQQVKFGIRWILPRVRVTASPMQPFMIMVYIEVHTWYFVLYVCYFYSCCRSILYMYVYVVISSILDATLYSAVLVLFKDPPPPPYLVHLVTILARGLWSLSMFSRNCYYYCYYYSSVAVVRVAPRQTQRSPCMLLYLVLPKYLAQHR